MLSKYTWPAGTPDTVALADCASNFPRAAVPFIIAESSSRFRPTPASADGSRRPTRAKVVFEYLDSTCSVRLHTHKLDFVLELGLGLFQKQRSRQVRTLYNTF